jgi:PleD family two-component response regulator
MKNHVLKSLMGLALIFVLLTGCTVFDSADDVTFDAVLPLDFKPVNETAVNNSAVQYSDVVTLNARDNADVEKYKDKIKSVKLTKITYVISDYAAPSPVTFTSGSLQANGKTLASATSVNLQSTAETELTDINQAGFDEFANQIKDDQSVEVTVAGTFSKTPVAFKIKAYFHVTITANALD